MEVEVEYEPIREGVPLSPEIDSFMRSQGFKMYDIANQYWKRLVPGIEFDTSLGDLTVGDVLYFRPLESILQLVAEGVFSLEQAIPCYLAYGYTHLAGVLVALATSKGLVDSQVRQKLLKQVDGFKYSRAFSWLPMADTIRWRAVHLIDRLFP